MRIYRSGVLQLALLMTAGAMLAAIPALADDVYGPINILKVIPTPFGPAKDGAASLAQALSLLDDDNAGSDRQSTASMKLPIAPALSGAPGASMSSQPGGNPIAMSSGRVILPHRSLADRLLQSKLYLPGRMVIGRTCEFTIKGRPGYFVALAMADKDSGAKPVYGHTLRLGPDRKLVAMGRIPADGLLHLIIDTPIEGDLIGLPLFFEAAIWSKSDFSDLEIASPVTSEGQVGVKNGVIVAAEPDEKHGLKFVPESRMPSVEITNPTYGVNSGQP